MATKTLLDRASKNQTSPIVDSYSPKAIFIQGVVSGGTLTAGTVQSETSIDGIHWDQATHTVNYPYTDIANSKIISVATGWPAARFVIASLAFNYGKTQTTGTGLSDLTIAGSYTPTTGHTYILKITNLDQDAVAATATVTSTGVNPTDGDTITVGTATYTFKDTLSTGPDVPFEVKVGGTAAITLDNLKLAVNAGANSGNYGIGTSENSNATADFNSDNQQVFTAKSAGDGGNSLDALTPIGTTLSFSDVTFTGGFDATADKFAWNKDGGAYSSNIEISGIAQDVVDGITVAFNATTGHDLGDEWTVTPAMISFYMSK